MKKIPTLLVIEEKISYTKENIGFPADIVNFNLGGKNHE